MLLYTQLSGAHPGSRKLKFLREAHEKVCSAASQVDSIISQIGQWYFSASEMAQWIKIPVTKELEFLHWDSHGPTWTHMDRLWQVVL